MGNDIEKRASLREYLALSLKGAAIGAANIIPGVSGGTMALILGVYEELIDSIKAFTSFKTVKLLFTLKFKEALETLPWKFLIALATGVAVSGIFLAKILRVTLENHAVLVWAFFFGLVIASILAVIKRVKIWKTSTFIGVVAGTVVAFFLVGMVPAETPDSWWFLIICGAIAMSAMILPGISGSFILLLLSKYRYIITALDNIRHSLGHGEMFKLNDFMTLLWTSLGCLVGAVSFVQLLSWLFRRYHDLTIAVLIGFMAGSLRRIWPWREVLRSEMVHGKLKVLEQHNILPECLDMSFYMALALAVAGFVSVVIMEYMATTKDKESE